MYSTLETCLTGLLLIYLLVDLILYFIFKTIPTTTKDKECVLGLSVIIASKNEDKNLKSHLPLVLSQNHPNFEVIIVDDRSTDDTFKIMEDLKQTYQNLRYVRVKDREKSSKKNALRYGIAQAKFEYLIFTDADCKPLSHEWLSQIEKQFSSKNSVVLGYSPYKTQKGHLNDLIRFETFITALHYFSFAKIGQAYMGVGRNLAYTKTIFNDLGQFDDHQHILSGDDDLFVNKASGKYVINCCLDPKTFVESLPKQSWKAWINQKRRHISTAPHYKLKHQLWLGFQFIIKFLFWFLLIPSGFALLFSGRFYFFFTLISLLIIKFLLSKTTLNKLFVKDLWLKSFYLEFQLICLQLYIFSLNLVSLKKDW